MKELPPEVDALAVEALDEADEGDPLLQHDFSADMLVNVEDGYPANESAPLRNQPPRSR